MLYVLDRQDKTMTGLQARAGGASITPPLPQAAGYVVVVVLGLVVAVGMLPSTWIDYGLDTNSAVMMYVTKILKNTTGEDNKKTEMYALHPYHSGFPH